jgi:hypothetical protein
MQNMAAVPQSYPHSPERYAADIQRAESYLARNGETIKLSPERIEMIRAHLRGDEQYAAGTIYAGGTPTGSSVCAGGGSSSGAGT